MTDQPWWETDRSWMEPEAFRALEAIIVASYPMVVIASACRHHADKETARIKAAKKAAEAAKLAAMPEGFREARARLHPNHEPGTEPFT